MGRSQLTNSFFNSTLSGRPAQFLASWGVIAQSTWVAFTPCKSKDGRLYIWGDEGGRGSGATGRTAQVRAGCSRPSSATQRSP